MRSSRVRYTAPVLFRIRKPNEHLDEDVEVTPDQTRPAAPDAGAPADAGADPIPFRQKAQSTAHDARAERLVMGLRSEMLELKDSIVGLRSRSSDLYSLDVDALAGDPAAATGLPHDMLVEALLAMRSELRQARETIRERDEALEALREEHRALQTEHAVANSRIETLGDVIGALHANLEDLRSVRHALTQELESRRLSLPEPGE